MSVKIAELFKGQEVWVVKDNKASREIIKKIWTRYIQFEDTWDVLHFNNISSLFTDWREAYKSAGITYKSQGAT